MNAFTTEGARAMLEVIQRTHLQFIANADTRDAFDKLLHSLLELSGSRFGLIAEVLDVDGMPAMRVHAVNDLGWDTQTRALYEGRLPRDADARGLQAVFDAVVHTRAAVAINDPAADERIRARSAAPTAQSVVGLPLTFGDALVGVAIAGDRPGGYPLALSRYLESYCATCAHLIIAYREGHKRQMAEAALRESEARFRMMADAAPMLLWMSNADRQSVFFNEGWLRFRGRSLREEADDGWLDGVHPHDRHRCQTVRQAATDAHAPFSVEYRLLRHDGEYRWLLDRGVPRFDDSGGFAGYIGACSDVTDIKAVEAALSESRAQLSGVIETAMDAIISVDEQQQICVFNAAAERMFGYRAQEVVGRALDLLLPERYRVVHRSHVEVFKTSGERSAEMGAARELSALHASGREFPIEASISRSRVAGKSLLTVIVRDVSKLRELGSARQAQAAAEAASRAKTVFLSRISHELRTPLNAVLGFAQLLTMNEAEPMTPQQREQVGHIIDAGQHLLSMITELLDLTRAEIGQMHVVSETVEVADVVRRSAQLVSALARERSVDLTCDLAAADGLMVSADAVRLTQVLVNLMSNAIKYNRQGGRVQVRALGLRDARVGVEVADDGIGMDDDQLAHLFEAFNRLGRERSPVEGAGIGLALAKQLLSLMQAEIEVRSALGSGSCFTVWLLPAAH